jgi:hypothetical protein
MSKPTISEREALLLARRVPLADIVLGRAYVIHARNGGVGIACLEHFEIRDDGKRLVYHYEGENTPDRGQFPQGQLNYMLHREKFKSHYLFPEVDWDLDPNHGTAIPLRLLPEIPPPDMLAAASAKDEGPLLQWLAEREEENKAEIHAAWEVVIGPFTDSGSTFKGMKNK